jgi:hypothetical protein
MISSQYATIRPKATTIAPIPEATKAVFKVLPNNLAPIVANASDFSCF